MLSCFFSLRSQLTNSKGSQTSHKHGSICVADWNKGVKYGEIFIFGSQRFLNYTVQTDRYGGALHSSTTTVKIINRNPLVPFIFVARWMLAVTNKGLMICLVLKKLGIHGQKFRYKSVWLTLTVQLLAVEKLDGIFLSIIYSADPSGQTVYDVCLVPLACWDCGFESLVYEYLPFLEFCVLSSRGLSDESIARQETT